MEKKPFPSETQERFIVRLPDGMRDKVADSSKANKRSMNSEIVARLQSSFETGDTLGDTESRLKSLVKNLEQLIIQVEKQNKSKK